MYEPVVHVWEMWQTHGAQGDLWLRGNRDGLLYRGTSWFVCQRRFGVKVWDNGAINNYWAYTLSDNGYWGWVNTVYISGGGDMSPVPGLALCPGGFGDSGSWPHDSGYHSGIFDALVDRPAKIAFDGSIIHYF